VLPFQIDHVIPVKHHGPTVAANLALACLNCNRHKSSDLAGIDEVTGALTRLFHPRQDSWDEHFAWQGAVLIGRTTVGRVTIDVLKINLAERVQHRRLLWEAGLFPPRRRSPGEPA